MKIKSLEIKNYMNFKDLDLDLTYPKGHQKAGEPLDKICIIGQSGTGKTNLLKIIREKFDNDSVKTIFLNEKKDNEKIYFAEAEKIYFDSKYINKSNMTKTDSTLLKEYRKERENIITYGSKYIGVSQFEKKLRDIDLRIEDLNNKYRHNIKILDFSNQTIINIDETAWSLLEEKIVNYNIEEKQFDSKLFNKIMLNTSYAKQAKIDKEKWREKNENILEKISDKLNSILIKFNLKLEKLDKNQKSYNDLIFKNLSNDKIIKYENLSTGTKNLISTFIPLKIHNPQDSIILIDEPENSFYPDIQRKLTDLYLEVGENNQLIFATHSPLIASSFEPWEVIELNFDENNQIYRKKYYKGENHIDNYTLDLRMLTWTGILMDIFDLKKDSNSNFREKEFIEYGILKSKIKSISDIKEKEKEFKKLQKIAKRLGLYNQ